MAMSEAGMPQGEKDTTGVRLPVSFEFFPPKSPEGVPRSCAACAKKLYALPPQFCSVTYGAGGSTQEGTFFRGGRNPGRGHGSGLVIFRASEPPKHGRCASNWQTLQRHGREAPGGLAWRPAQRLWCGRRVQLRQRPGGLHPRRNRSDHFHIEVAAYPEIHPQSRSAEADLRAYATKVRAGANSAITQYFYNADAYVRFVDEAARMGVDAPVVPGIMPIISSTQLMRFSDACGAEIPRWIRLRLQGFGDDTASIRAFGLDVVTALCEQLVRAGAPGLHFYTMNQSAATTEIVRRLGLA
jgi:methylenetetrahydrofolate reductase (NADPH)